MLDLNDYRARIALDAPYVAPEPARDALKPEMVSRLVTALRGEGLGLPPGTVVDDERELLRALLTVRPPGDIADALLTDLDAVLQLETRARGVVRHSWLREFGTRDTSLRVDAARTVWRGDITRLEIDAIVNAGNDQLLGCFVPFHRCIDNAIHDVAGPRLRADCARIMQAQGHREATGNAKVTRAYNLPARFVLHTVGPIVQGPLTAQHRHALARSYDACLELACRVGIRSIAFCAVSTGLYGFPKDAAAAIALDTVQRWLAAHPDALEHVVFNVFDSESFHAYATHIAGAA